MLCYGSLKNLSWQEIGIPCPYRTYMGIFCAPLTRCQVVSRMSNTTRLTVGSFQRAYPPVTWLRPLHGEPMRICFAEFKPQGKILIGAEGIHGGLSLLLAILVPRTPPAPCVGGQSYRKQRQEKSIPLVCATFARTYR